MAAEGRLRRVVVDDVKIEAIRDTIIGNVSNRLQSFWTHDGKGVWTKVTSSTSQPDEGAEGQGMGGTI